MRSSQRIPLLRYSHPEALLPSRWECDFEYRRPTLFGPRTRIKQTVYAKDLQRVKILTANTGANLHVHAATAKVDVLTDVQVRDGLERALEGTADGDGGRRGLGARDNTSERGASSDDDCKEVLHVDKCCYALEKRL